MTAFRTFVDVHVGPNVLAFTNVHSFAQLDGKLDRAGDLYGVGLLETFLDEDSVDNTPN
jgi:hypothetical protein